MKVERTIQMFNSVRLNKILLIGVAKDWFLFIILFSKQCFYDWLEHEKNCYWSEASIDPLFYTAIFMKALLSVGSRLFF